MYKNNVEIIVSRYNEDLTWLNEYPFNQFEYIVYNKGDNDNFEKNNVKKIIHLPNIGRCDHTYLYHIIENYDNLSGIVVFLTGSLKNNMLKKNKAITILNNIINSSYTNAYFLGFYHNNLREHYTNFTLDYYSCSDPENYNKNSENILQKCKLRPYGLWYKYFFGNTIAHWCTLGGIFSIDKRDIIQHPVIRYQRLIESVNKHSNPEAGHYIERSWCAIFYPLIYTQKISC
jgi:hypothetical protein